MSTEDVDILEHFWCSVHLSPLYGRDCDTCGGEGAYHDCGEDSCCCADPEDPNYPCSDCRGTGRVIWCPEWTEAQPCMKKDWREVNEKGELVEYLRRKNP